MAAMTKIIENDTKNGSCTSPHKTPIEVIEDIILWRKTLPPKIKALRRSPRLHARILASTQKINSNTWDKCGRIIHGLGTAIGYESVSPRTIIRPTEVTSR